jgi:hypothetical protein
VFIKPDDIHEVWHVTLPYCRYDTIDNVIKDAYRVEWGANRRIMGKNKWRQASHIAMAMRLRAAALIGTPYDKLELVVFHLAQEMGWNIGDGSDPDKYVCSSGVEEVFNSARIPMCPDDPLVSPDDLLRSKYYQYIGGMDLG